MRNEHILKYKEELEGIFEAAFSAPPLVREIKSGKPLSSTAKLFLGAIFYASVALPLEASKDASELPTFFTDLVKLKH